MAESPLEFARIMQTITFDRHGFIFSGTRRFILAGTVNYFRLHPDDWRPRLEALKACGFNTVDTYVAWNYHERVEGQFDFTTLNRDLSRFLSLCGEVGLWVYFRPGPYICNEWDGGGLPAWLSTKPEVELRQNQPAYLRYVTRYLHQVNQIARQHLYTKGGPIILYALENELDFYACRDTHGYISALKQQALADGIDVPLTACVGLRTLIKRATGLVDGVIPSPNIYAAGAIERKAERAYNRVLTGEYASGRHMDDVPVFVTETHHDENALRRILSGGFKGLSPFNFSGGTHFGYWNASNNWDSQTLISTSVDFSSPITFDGRLGPRYFSCRLLAGLIDAFEQQLLACDPITSEDAGPRSSNPSLGWKDAGESHGTIYSLMRDGTAFVFLYNGTAEAQDLAAEVEGTRFPRYCTTRIAAGYTHIALTGLSLAHAGVDATLRYSSAEVAGLCQTDQGAELVVYGPSGGQGELCIESAHGIQVMGAVDGLHREGDGRVTLVVQYGQCGTTELRIGEKVLTLTVQTREQAMRRGLKLAERERGLARELAAEPWRVRRLKHVGQAHRWEGQESRAMETMGILQGAAWYELRVELDQPLTGELVIEQAAEFVSVFADGEYLGTFLGNGGPVEAALPGPLAAGRHTLRFRTEIWGHANFDDAGWPSGRIGSLRGVLGKVTIGGAPLCGQWSCGAESLVGDGQEQLGRTEIAGRPGESTGFAIDLPPMPEGAALVLAGTDVLGELRIGEQLLGRFAFGPGMLIKLKAGPGNEFYLPAGLVRDGARLEMVVRTTAAGGRLDSIALYPLV